MKQLEALVHDLRGELDRARGSSTGAASSAAEPSSAEVFTTPSEHGPRRVSHQVGDLSSAFWGGMDEQLGELRDGPRRNGHDEEQMTADDGPSQTSSAIDTRSQRNCRSSSAFILGSMHPSEQQETSKLFPLASQVPFLLEVFAERVHSVIAIPHMPYLKKLLHHSRISKGAGYSHEEEALIFAVFYVSICSLDDDEVVASFDAAKDDLAARYRSGFEVAASKSNLIGNPSQHLVQALLIFLTLARLHESPKYLWMMTGLVIRMARFLRYHEDGASSGKISAFQAEMQRRVWWNLCALDLRATEDQGTELAIPSYSFSTGLPYNVEDSDIWPGMEKAPPERSGLTSLSLLRLCSKVTRTTQTMIEAGRSASLNDHVRLIDDLSAELDRDYFSIANQSQHPAYLAAAGTVRVFLGRLTLLAFLPALLASTAQGFSMDIRNKMLVASIEIAELNHALNAEPSCLPWRWVYQTQQHWHAVVFILIEICLRSWSPTVERAWVALRSPWLLPARVQSYQNPTVWVPLKRLMARARNHREKEIERLRRQPHAAEGLFREDRERMPYPSSSVTFPSFYSEDKFYWHWQQLVDPNITLDAVTIGAPGATTDSPHNAFEFRGHRSAPSKGVDRNQPTTVSLHFAHSVHSGQVGPTAGAEMDPAAGFGNLDALLVSDTDVELFGELSDEDFLNFDWNSWFEAANGTL